MSGRFNVHARAALELALKGGLHRVAGLIVSEARKKASRRVDTGAFRQSIAWDDSPVKRLEVLVGYSLHHAPHAQYLALGFRPHWVPARYVGRWMQRHGVGLSFRAGGRRYKTARAVALGLYVGGPGSTLKYGGSGARGKLFGPGGRLMERTWATKGGKSPFLPPGKVGDPVLRETVRELPLERLIREFERGWRHALKPH